jgi:hypothetical protein
MSVPGNGHDKEIEQPHPDGRKPRIEKVLETAQNLVNAVEQFLLLYAMGTTMETDMTLAAVRAARAMLQLVHVAWRVHQNKQR